MSESGSWKLWFETIKLLSLFIIYFIQVVFFTNSKTEANELAMLIIARLYIGCHAWHNISKEGLPYMVMQLEQWEP